MKNLDSFSIKKNNADYDNEINERTNLRYNYLNTLMQINISSDYLKLIAIILLLTSSIIMYNYQPSSIIHRVNNTQTLNNGLQNEETEDNPYGFQPLYQVHKRIRYQNPTINICDGIKSSKTLLLAILSRANNAHIREAIRQTWGGVRVYNKIEIRLIFIVGIDDGMIKQIELEQAIYHGKFYLFNKKEIF